LRAFLWEECPFLFLHRRFRYLVLFFAVVACSDSRTQARVATDDFGDQIRIGVPPTRIVSLNPATTEMLFSLGAGHRLVGRSKYDLWPDSAKLVPSVGNGMRPNVEAVLGTHPDLVILYASQDDRPTAARLRAAGVNTLSLKTDHISDFRRTMSLLGAITGDTARARIIVDSVYHTLDSVRSATARLPRPTVFWHIWDAPIITIGSGSFLNELVDIAGGKNAYADITASSAEISLEDIAHRDPDFILAGPVGKAQIEGDPRWHIVRAEREKKILVVDTTLVGRPSVRLGEAAVSLAKLLHPGALR
jgi:ABC-type Fe3+-hydroxamate transport system substrate-binding protein